jgi:hypothetical protein
MSKKIQNQIKFKRYILNDEGYKNDSEGHSPILLPFYENHKIVGFKDLGHAH